MRSLGRLLSLLLLVGCGYVCPHEHACPQLEEDDAAADALERAARYLSRRSVGGDEAWFVRQGAATLGGDFVPWARSVYVDPPRNKGSDGRMAQLGFRSFPPLPNPPELRDRQPREGPISLDDRKRGYKAIAIASRCTGLDDEAKADFIRLCGRLSHSYFAVAQLWAVTTAGHLGCLRGHALDRLRRDTAARVLAETLADPHPHDLTAERIATLIYAGYGDKVPRRHIDALVEAQHPVGVWLDPHFDGGPYARPTATHMTAVAFYVLARSREASP